MTQYQSPMTEILFLSAM